MENKKKESLYISLIKEFKNFKGFSSSDILHPFKIDTRFKGQKAINPWELWYGNLEAEILVIGQDFSDKKYFTDNLNTNWQKEIDSPTNKTLQALFENLDYHIELPKNEIVNKSLPLFFTNAVLGIKQNGMTGPIKEKWYRETAKLYTKELINIIQPKYIITLGKHAYNMMCIAYDLEAEKLFKNVKLEQDLNQNFQWFAVSHCSPTGRINRKLEKQHEDWKAMKKLMDK
ncbi:MAG: uracil-DNA glycosylase family protein [Bacteroidia bacterium]|nr:uracil-DNA glycosylase family protein [Bacteroidia bacterium]